MTKPLRRSMALVTLALLLVSQAAPGADLCVCDPARPGACCGREAKPVETESGCCATGSGDADVLLTHTTHVPDEAAAVLSPSACKRSWVSSESSAAALPSPLHLHKTDTQDVVACDPSDPGPNELPCGTTPSRRAPPPGHADPLFLLHASFRL